MNRRTVCGLLVAVAVCGVAVAEDFYAVIRKAGDGKVSFYKGRKAEGEKRTRFDKEETTLAVANNLKVFHIKGNKQKRTSERGEELPGGLANEQLKKRLAKVKTQYDQGVFAQILTDDNGKIKEIRVDLFEPKQSP